MWHVFVLLEKLIESFFKLDDAIEVVGSLKEIGFTKSRNLKFMENW